METAERDRTTSLLARASAGDSGAEAPLLDVVYARLRALAASYLSGQAQRHTLQPTALVHEAFIRIVDHSRCSPQDEGHFLALAATAMRQILVDHARSRGALKRGGDHRRITLSGLDAGKDAPVDLLDLDEALGELAQRSERQVRVVELRFFGGLSVPQCAALLGVSDRTIESDWRMARAWLHATLVRGASP